MASKEMEIILQGVQLSELLERIGQVIDEKMSSQHRTKPVEQSGYLSRKETAQKLRITLQTLNTWTKEGYFNSYKIGSRRLYKESEVEEVMNKVQSFKHKKGGYHA